MLAAIDLAILRDEFLIPTEHASALRLQFMGLKSALRREGNAGKIDQLSFYLREKGLLIQKKTLSPLAQDIAAALAEEGLTTPSELLDAEAALSRIFNATGTK